VRLGGPGVARRRVGGGDAIASARDEIVVFHPFLLDDDARFDVLRWAISDRDGPAAAAG
jgi:hypothetical protein